MARWIGIVASLLALTPLIGCGEGQEGERRESPGTEQVVSASDLKRLRLTDTPPAVVQQACERAADRSSLTVVCPSIVPAGGDQSIQYAGRLEGRRGPADAYSVHLVSSSLRRNSGDPENPGHWAVEAAASASVLRRALVDEERIRDCRRLRDRGVSPAPGPCRPVRHARRLNGVPVTEYRLPPYPTGGLHGGHLVFLWEGDDAAYLISVHDPHNRERAVAMASALIAETTGM